MPPQTTGDVTTSNESDITTWNQEEAGIKSRGARIRMHKKGFVDQLPIRPYPWNLLNDNACIAASAVFLGIFGPLMAGVIGSALAAMFIVQKIYSVIPGVFHAAHSTITRCSKWLADRIMHDPRNYPYIPWTFFMAVWAPAILYYAWQRHSQNGFEIWFCLFYHLMRIGPRFRLFAHLHVLVHKEGHDHKGLYKGPFAIFNYVTQWWIGPFYGQTPMSYEAGHNKIHHRFDNGLDDVHTNLDLDRSKPISLLIYFPRFYFYWSGISCIWFFVNRRMWSLAIKMFAGFTYHHAVMAYFMYIDWTFGLAYAVYPFIESTIFFALISYLWHAWMDPNDPSNAYVNSVTILNGHDNIWNEDYHVVHHTSQCHWTEYPAHYQRNIEKYKASKATIFQDCEEGEMLHWLLSEQWDKLAEHFVDLENKMTHEEKKALLLERLRATISKVN